MSCWGLSPGGIQDLFQGSKEVPRGFHIQHSLTFPPGGMLKLPGHKSLTGKVLNKQHLQLLCPKELNGFVSSAPQGGIQQGRGEDIPCACWWWSPGRERGGKGSLSSLRTSETQFSKVSHEHDLTETLAGTGKALILGESKGNIFKRVDFLQRTPDCIACDLQLKPAKLEVLP